MEREPDLSVSFDLDLRKLRYFVAVAEEMHFGRAAERLYVAQPVLSRQIRKLEQQLDVELFTRTSRDVRLTAAGRELLDDARPLLAAADAAQRRVRRTASSRRTLTVGFFVGDPVSRAVHAFSALHTDVTVDLMRIYWCDQTEVLLDGRVDVAFVHLPIDEAGLKLAPLYAAPRVARQDRTSIADLADDPVILHSGASPDWEAFHNTDPRPDGRHPRLGPTVSNIEEKLEHVAAGRGISFLPPTAASAIVIQPDVVAVPVADIPPTQVCLAWSGGAESPLILTFVEAAREAVSATDDAEAGRHARAPASLSAGPQ